MRSRSLDIVRMAVKNPYPSKTLYLQKLFQEILQRLSFLQILSIHGGILGYEVNLFNTLVRHPLGFTDKRFHSPAPERPPQFGDDAVGALVGASFSDLQVGGVKGS
jgi:hypothetical protein